MFIIVIEDDNVKYYQALIQISGWYALVNYWEQFLAFHSLIDFIV